MIVDYKTPVLKPFIKERPAYSIAGFKKALNYIDWKLLLFLIFFLDVKLAVKIPAVLLIYALRFNFRFGFSLKNSRLPLFYLLIMGVAFAGLIINQNFRNPDYMLVFLTGIVFWSLCILAIHQVKLAVENNEAEVIQRTILAFFVINAAVSFFNIAQIIWETGALNPYLYQGENQKYFIGTGDYVRGLTFDTSTTNAVLNSFGVVYFLTQKKPAMVLVCMAVLLLTGSNFTTLVLMSVLTFLFIFRSDKDQKSLVIICLMFLVVFMAKISPQNNKYVFEGIGHILQPGKPQTGAVAAVAERGLAASPEALQRKFAQHYIDSVSYLLSRKQTVRQPVSAITNLPNDHGRVLIAGPDINKPPYLTPTDTTFEEKQLLTFIDAHKAGLPISGRADFKPGLPGKITAMLQTISFLRHHPVKIIAGDGAGNFSSKLAFRATGLGMEGAYPKKLVYIGRDFLSNHLDIYLNFFSKRAGFHSLINSPYSVYDQLLAEYGIAGLGVFILFYAGFFAGNYRKLTYGIPLLMLMTAFFFIDYWFEQLSVLVFFELLLLLDIKSKQHDEVSVLWT